MSAWWRRRPAPVDEGRWVVLDVEASGLDARRDRLLAIAGIAIHVDWPRRRLAIALGDSFEVVLRQEQLATAKDNILLHGIGVQRQREGLPAPAALQAFEAWGGASPLIAFHAAFDQTLIERARQAAALPRLPNPWLDLEHLCAVTHEEVRARSLDEWMDHFGIRCARRHEAAADTLAECELLLRVWPRAAPECLCWAEVQALAARHRWLARR